MNRAMRAGRHRSLRWFHRVILLLLAGSATACGSGAGASSGDWLAQVDTLGDTTVVRTLSGSEWGTAELVLDMRIGTLEGAEHEMFGTIRGLALSPEGDIYVVDTQVPALRKYAADGTYLATFGREGGGPGEYGGNMDGGLAVLTDSRVLLRDPTNGRFTVYSAEGEYLESWPGPLRSYTYVAVFPLPDGGFLNPVDRPGVSGTHLGRYASNGIPVDTIQVPRPDYSPPMLTARDGGSSQSWRVPFTPNAVWTATPSGEFLSAITDRYAIDRHRSDGTVLRMMRDAVAIPVSAAERSADEERVYAAMRGMDPAWRWNGPPIPATKPLIQEIFSAVDGRIWVHLHQPAEQIADEPRPASGEPFEPPRFREPVVFDVFEADGRYLGQVHAPEGFSTSPRPVFESDHVWATMRDDLDVQYIARFRIERAGD